MKKILILFYSLLFLIPSSLVFAEAQTYTVQRTDTLWDISDRFFHDPWLWPNLWKNNPHITNPHLIFPGNKVLLSIETKGIIESTTEKKGPAEVLKLEVEPAPEAAKKIKVEPPPAGPQPQTYTYLGMNTLGFISPEKLKEKGTIKLLPERKDLLSQGDTVYLLASDKEFLPVGSTWTVYRAPHVVRHPATGKKVGYYYLPLGNVEIIQAGNSATGKIISSHQAISVGDILMPCEEIPSDVTLKEPIKMLAATIIKTEPPVVEIAQHHIVYLDKGKKGGIEVGNSLEVFRTKELAGHPQYIALGEILVLRTQEETSTALVTRSKEPFALGHKARTKTH